LKSLSTLAIDIIIAKSTPYKDAACWISLIRIVLRGNSYPVGVGYQVRR